MRAPRTRPVVDAGHEVAQHVGADHAVHLQEELEREGEHHEVRQRVEQVRVAEARYEARADRPLVIDLPDAGARRGTGASTMRAR